MRRPGSLLLLPFLLLTVGCSAYAYDGVFEGPRHERRVVVDHDEGPRGRRFHRRVQRDVQRYVRRLDQYLHLNRRQERRIRRLLAERTHQLAGRTHPEDYHRVYPFPRRYQARQGHRLERWWRQTDRRIERVLSRRQRYAYRDFVHGRDGRHDRRRGH